MKKLYFILVGLSFIYWPAHAQITINANDITPVGVTAIQTLDSLPPASIQIGGTGQQNWDFSSLKEHETNPFFFLMADETPYSSYFPNSNLAIGLDTSGYIYFTLDNTSLRIDGTYGTINVDTISAAVDMKINPPQSVIRFPATINNSFNETVHRIIQAPGSLIGLPVDSVRSVTTVRRSVTIDAFGNMTTPAGTFESLRSSEREISTDTTYVLFFGNWQVITASPMPDTSFTYNWWAKQGGFGFPIVSVEVMNGNVAGDVTWLKEFTTSSLEAIPQLEVHIHPNPASEWLSVRLPEALNGEIEVYDFRGRLSLKLKLRGKEETLNIQPLLTGNYVLVVKNSKGQVAGVKQFAVGRKQ